MRPNLQRPCCLPSRGLINCCPSRPAERLPALSGQGPTRETGDHLRLLHYSESDTFYLTFSLVFHLRPIRFLPPQVRLSPTKDRKTENDLIKVKKSTSLGGK